MEEKERPLSDFKKQWHQKDPFEKVSCLIEAIHKKLQACQSDGAAPQDLIDTRFKRNKIPILIEQAFQVLSFLPAGPVRQKLKVRLLEKKAWWAIEQEAFSEALQHLEGAKHLLEEIPESIAASKLRILNFEAFVFFRKGHYAEAIRIFRATREQAVRLPPEEQEKIVNNDLGLALLGSGKAKEAIEVLKEDGVFFKKLEKRDKTDTYFFHRSLYNLAECFLQLGQFKKALAVYRQISQKCQRDRQATLLLRAYNGMANVYALLGKNPLSLNYYGRAFDLAISLADHLSAGCIAQNRGFIRKKEKEYDKARKEFSLSLQLLQKVAEPTLIVHRCLAQSKLALAEMAQKEKEHSLAREYLIEANLLIRKEEMEDLFFPLLYAQAQMALDQKDEKKLAILMPELTDHAQTDDQKTRVDSLRKKSGIDPVSLSGEGKKEDKKDRPLNTILKINRLLEEKLECAERQLDTFELLLKGQEPWKVFSSPHEGMIGQAPAMEKVFRLVDRVAPTHLSVVITGESGTGKELIARAIHNRSAFKTGPFIAINCGAIPSALLESELFGYKAGAFTGAARDKKGLIEAAHNGTLFLDEIGELELPLQVKLLRMLQEREIVRLGDTQTIPLHMRVVSASVRDLAMEAKKQRFRQDLYYRVAEVTIRVPPLRERREDIPLLVNFFVGEFAKEKGWKKSPSVDRSLRSFLMRYSWPGNIRELKSQVRVALSLSDGKRLTADDLAEPYGKIFLPTSAVPTSPAFPLPAQMPSARDGFHSLLEEKKSLREIKTVVMALSLMRHQMDVKKTSQELQVCPATLYNWMNKDSLLTRLHEFEVYSSLPPLSLEETEQQVISLALARYRHKPYLAARHLRVSPATLYQRMKASRHLHQVKPNPELSKTGSA